ncbi:hypothetical protein [Burkholderia ambifaria]|uniref:hypothetical protein n=1 Tax=Burkholderia ambifaria TaxID=152480 RepID=UPI002FE154B2
MSENTLSPAAAHTVAPADRQAAADSGPLERPFSVVIAELAAVRPMVETFIRARGGNVSGSTYAEMLSFAATIYRESRAGSADRWNFAPAVPTTDELPFYGDQYSVPVLLNDGNAIIPEVARWDYAGAGWVDANFREGPDACDYEWLNQHAKGWMLLSDAAPTDAASLAGEN